MRIKIVSPASDNSIINWLSHVPAVPHGLYCSEQFIVLAKKLRHFFWVGEKALIVGSLKARCFLTYGILGVGNLGTRGLWDPRCFVLIYDRLYAEDCVCGVYDNVPTIVRASWVSRWFFKVYYQFFSSKYDICFEYVESCIALELRDCVSACFRPCAGESIGWRSRRSLSVDINCRECW